MVPNGLNHSEHSESGSEAPAGIPCGFASRADVRSWRASCVRTSYDPALIVLSRADSGCSWDPLSCLGLVMRTSL